MGVEHPEWKGMTIEEYGVKVRLGVDKGNGPSVTAWIGRDAGGTIRMHAHAMDGFVAMTVGTTAFSFTPDQARTLANALLEIAAEAER